MSVRLRGFLIAVACGIACATLAYWIANPETYPFAYYPAGIGGAILVGAPGAGVIVGLIELFSGQPFYKVEEAWGRITGWRKFLFSLLIVLIGGAIAFTIVGVAVL